MEEIKAVSQHSKLYSVLMALRDIPSMPGFIDAEALRESILTLPGIQEVHDLHLWTLTSGMSSASLHIRTATDRPHDEIIRAVQDLIKERTGVDHATVQIDAATPCQSEGHR